MICPLQTIQTRCLSKSCTEYLIRSMRKQLPSPCNSPRHAHVSSRCTRQTRSRSSTCTHQQYIRPKGVKSCSDDLLCLMCGYDKAHLAIVLDTFKYPHSVPFQRFQCLLERPQALPKHGRVSRVLQRSISSESLRPWFCRRRRKRCGVWGKIEHLLRASG